MLGAPPRPRPGPLASLALAAVAAALAVLPRLADDTQRVPLDVDPAGGGEPGWVSSDADSAYHMRRVRRALVEGLPPAERDPLLNHPEGAVVPWPPYYTWVLWAAVAPGAPLDDDAALRRHVEGRTASLPLVFGALTAALAALAAARLGARSGGRGAAWTAGLVAAALYAFAQAAVNYARLGNGDHHAFVSLLHAAALWLLTLALADGRLAAPRRAALLGAAAGAVLGLALGTWVASLVYVVEVELLLAVLLLVHARRALPGLAALGLAFHVAALVAVAPAVLSSPWKEASPWFVINLSWYHLLHLALGALVFVPLLLRPADERLRRAHPWAVAAALAVLTTLLFALDTPIARGIAEGFDWASATDSFMAEVRESRPLLGPGSLGAGALLRALGAGAFLLPVAWLAAALAAWRAERAALLPWVVAAPVVALEAAGQYRFADALAVPLAVLLGWAFAALVARLRAGRGGNVPWPAAALGVVLALLSQLGTLDATADALAGAPRPALAAEHERHRAVRDVCAWLAARDDAPGAPRGVLASWGLGHVIEWAAERPTVATNFGAYVGAEGFRSPARFFLARDPERALEVLAARDVRWVVPTAQLPRALPRMVRAADPALARELAGVADARSFDDWDGSVTPAWLRTMGARLLFAGVDAPGAPPGVPPPPRTLRLVHRAARRDPQPGLGQLGRDVPALWVWERVAGAVVEARGAEGSELAVTLEVVYPDGFRLRFEAAATAQPETEQGGAAAARVRVPYATEAPNGDGEVVSARWSFAGGTGALRLGAADVLGGGTVRLP